MATLTGTTIASTYDSLLHVEDNTAGLVATSTDSRVIQDGVGANSALALATDSVRITSTNKLYFNDVGGEYISGDGSILSIVGGNEIDLTATAIDINGTADISGAVGLASSSGVTTIGSSNGLTVSAAGVLTVNSATDSTSKTTGSTIIDGGVGIAKTLHVGTGIVEEGGTLKENLLTNSGFDVWSNSTLVSAVTGAAPVLDDAGDLITNGDGTSTTGWSVHSGSLAVDSNTLKHTASGVQYFYQAVTVVVGKLYRVSWELTGTGTSSNRYALGGTAVVASAGYDSYYSESSVGTGVQTFIIKATSTSLVIQFGTNSGTSFWDNIMVHEVTPGCVATDVLGPDGWYKDAGAASECWRMHSDGNTESVTKLGSFYALKMTFAGSGYEIKHSVTNNTPEYLARFNGRTITLGCWLKSSSATLLKTGNSGTPVTTVAHSGGGGWEWLEIKSTIPSNATWVNPFVIRGAGTETIYLSQPMVVYGSSIGEGNYTRPQGEVIWNEDRHHLNSFNGDSMSDVGNPIELESESNGKIPKGAKAIYVILWAKDSDTATDTPYFRLYGKDKDMFMLGVDMDFADAAGRDDKDTYASGWVSCEVDGTGISFSSKASGSNTLDVYITILGVELN